MEWKYQSNNNNKHLHGVYHMPGSVLGSSHIINNSLALVPFLIIVLILQTRKRKHSEIH